jgi:hypothetical protein
MERSDFGFFFAVIDLFDVKSDLLPELSGGLFLQDSLVNLKKAKDFPVFNFLFQHKSPKGF